MMANDRISVIIPVYNCERYVEEAVRSVIGQTLKPCEIIVVDDGSTDKSADIVKRFGEKVSYFYQPNGGAAKARNVGVAKASGDFLAFLDSDDVWVPDKLAGQLDVFERNPSVDMVFGYVQNFHSPELTVEMKAKIQGPMQAMPGRVAGALLIKRSSFLRAGFFEESLRVGEFMDWYLRAKEKNLKCVILDEVLLKRRLHGSNMGVRDKSSRVDYARILKAALDRKRKNVDGANE